MNIFLTFQVIQFGNIIFHLKSKLNSLPPFQTNLLHLICFYIYVDVLQQITIKDLYSFGKGMTACVCERAGA